VCRITVTSLRGLVTSLGAGGSLIAAALCALVIVGGILAVREATGGTARGEAGDVVMPGATDVASVPSDSPEPAASRAERRAVVRGDRPAARRRPARRQTIATRPRRSAPRLDASSPPATPVGSSPSESSPSESSPAGSAPSAPSTGDQQPGTVRRVVAQTRESVEPVAEAVPEPVQPVVDDVVVIVDDVAGTVDETLAPVTGLLP
jgi:hypothetical protein